MRKIFFGIGSIIVIFKYINVAVVVKIAIVIQVWGTASCAEIGIDDIEFVAVVVVVVVVVVVLDVTFANIIQSIGIPRHHNVV